jgi:hypothetical protein
MTSKIPNDKRRVPRYLCSEQFSDTVMYLKGQIYMMISVNYNHTGMALYSHERLPDNSACYLSFQYNLDNRLIVLNQIECSICYRVETEVGHQYGIKFKREQLRDIDRDKLDQIERHLASQQTLENRWQ